VPGPTGSISATIAGAPPCHAVTFSQCAPSAASGGSSFAVTACSVAASGVTARPMAPPRMPAPMAHTSVTGSASAISDSGHGLTIHTCDQPYSAKKPTVPISTPAMAPIVIGRR
jgi:hypothetical protein